MNKAKQQKIFTDAMSFAINDDEPNTFLKLWLEGDWDSLQREWPEYSIPVELQEDAYRYSDRIRADRQIVINAYRHDFDGPGCVALMPVQDAASIVIKQSEVEAFLSILDKDDPLDNLLLENCQDDLIEEGGDNAILVSAEIPLFEFRKRTFCWQQTDMPASRSELLKKMHLASAPWQSLGADMIQIIGYARQTTSR